MKLSRIIILTALVLSPIFLTGAKKPKGAKENIPNPIIEGWYADPDIIIADGQYWIYPTGGKAFNCFSSPDLKTWEKHDSIVLVQDMPWVRNCKWAPCVIEKDGKFYFFFSANDIHPGDLGGIGVAVADNPAGPFRDYIGHPLIGEHINGAQPIDQGVFKDDDGQYYMYYGGWSHCNVVKLNDQLNGLLPFDDGSYFKEVTPEGYVEGPMMFKKDGKYYFMWSEGNWTKADYRVAYAIADSPLGPFKRVATVLESDMEVGTGAGHHSVLKIPGREEYYIVYHRHPLNDNVGGHRYLCIDKMTFDENGYINHVKITNEGIQPIPLAGLK